MTAVIMMTTLDRPATTAELTTAATLIAEGYLEGQNTIADHGTLWARVAERTPSGMTRAEMHRRTGAVVLPRLEDERGPLARDFAPGHFEATARGVIRKLEAAA